MKNNDKMAPMPIAVSFRTYHTDRSYREPPAIFLREARTVGRGRDKSTEEIVHVIRSRLVLTEEVAKKYSPDSVFRDDKFLDAIGVAKNEQTRWEVKQSAIITRKLFDLTIKPEADRSGIAPTENLSWLLCDLHMIVNLYYTGRASEILKSIPEPIATFKEFLTGLESVVIRRGELTGRTARSFAVNVWNYCDDQLHALEAAVKEAETKVSNRIIIPAGRGEKITARAPKAIAKRPDPENVDYFNTVDTAEKREALASELIKNNLACFYTTFDGEPTAVAKVLKVIEQAGEAYRARYMYENKRGEQPTSATTGVLSKDNKTLTISLEVLARERPDYDKLTPKEQRAERCAWFKALVYAASRPCMFYAGMERGRDKTVIKQLFLLEYDTLAPLDHDVKLIKIDPVLMEPSTTGGKRRHGFSRIDRRAYRYLQSSAARPETVKAAFLALNHIKARLTTMINHAEGEARKRNQHRKEGEPEILPTYQPVEIVLADLVTYQKTYLTTKATSAKGIVHAEGERSPILPNDKPSRDAVLKELENALMGEHIHMEISESRESILLEIERDPQNEVN